MTTPTVTYVTGASGFIGKHVLASFQGSETEVVIGVGRSAGLTHYDDLLSHKLADDSAIIHLAGKAHDLHSVPDEAEYDAANYVLTRSLYDAFRASNARIFVFVSSVKAVTDNPASPVNEDTPAEPKTAYGRSKLKAERYVTAHPARPGQLVYILQPCVVQGPGAKGNVRLLMRFVQSGLPYPLAAFHNQRSVLSIDNLVFCLHSILRRPVPEGRYLVADDDPLSAVDMVKTIAAARGRSPRLLSPSIRLVRLAARLGTRLRLPLTTERLDKLTEDHVIDNSKLLTALGVARLPTDSAVGLARSVNCR